MGAQAAVSFGNVYWEDANGEFKSTNTMPAFAPGKATIYEFWNNGANYWMGRKIALVPAYPSFR